MAEWQALNIILELDNKRGRGVCFNNMGNCVRSLDLQNACSHGTEPYSTQPEVLTVGYYTGFEQVMGKVEGFHHDETGSMRPLWYSPDMFFRLAVQEEERLLTAEEVSPTLATRRLNRALFLISQGQIAEGANLLETVLGCDQPQVLTTVAWGSAADLKLDLLSQDMSQIKDVLLRICDRAEALFAEKQVSTGLAFELAHNYADLLIVRCFLDPDPGSQAARAWGALRKLPRLKEQQVKAFSFFIKNFARTLAPELNKSLLPIDVTNCEDLGVESAVFGVRSSTCRIAIREGYHASSSSPIV